MLESVESHHVPLVAELPLAPLVRALRAGELLPSEFVERQCLRMDAVEPLVQSLLPEAGRRARLAAEAEQLQVDYPDSGERPPLFGVLVGIKDIFHVDGFVTRAGCSIPPEEFAGDEAAVVRALRQAGALIAGKTVTTEFAYFEPGPTANPHNPAHTPGGSSSGSAAVVAAGIVPLAVGTQTIGSVIRPAAFCGIVGFKPSLHRVPSAGMVYFSPTIDHVGLFTQDVEGMTSAAAALCVGWRGTGQARLPALGVPAGAYLQQADSEMLAHFEATLARLLGAGASIKRVPLFEEIESLNQLHRRLVFAEFARGHARLFARFADSYRPRTREIIELGRAVNDAELESLRTNVLALRAEIAAVMEAFGLDGWVCPPAVGAAPQGLHATGDPNLNLPWTHAGMPALTIPAGRAANGLPLGLQLVARFSEDEALLGWGIAVQEALRALQGA